MTVAGIATSRRPKSNSCSVLTGSPNVDMDTALHVFQTDLGWFAIVGSAGVLSSIDFGFRSESAAVAAAARRTLGVVEREEWHTELAERLTGFAAGEGQDFSDVVIANDHLTPFARRVVNACRQVRWGQTATYGGLARRAGSANAARAVGTVMSKNRYPIIVPCHRIVPSNGKLGGFSSPQGVSMKRRLLEMEAAW